jgi:hypothetical protein
LILGVLFEAIGIIPVPSIGWSTGGFYVGHLPWLGPQGTQQGGRMKCPGSNFHIIGLLDDTALFGPELVQFHDYILKIHIAAASVPCLINL